MLHHNTVDKRILERFLLKSLVGQNKTIANHYKTITTMKNENFLYCQGTNERDENKLILHPFLIVSAAVYTDSMMITSFAKTRSDICLGVVGLEVAIDILVKNHGTGAFKIKHATSPTVYHWLPTPSICFRMPSLSSSVSLRSG